jgi:hypothetical protein
MYPMPLCTSSSPNRGDASSYERILQQLEAFDCLAFDQFEARLHNPSSPPSDQSRSAASADRRPQIQLNGADFIPPDGLPTSNATSSAEKARPTPPPIPSASVSLPRFVPNTSPRGQSLHLMSLSSSSHPDAQPLFSAPVDSVRVCRSSHPLYAGGFNERNQAHGKGKLVDQEKGTIMEGTWIDGLLEGHGEMEKHADSPTSLIQTSLFDMFAIHVFLPVPVRFLAFARWIGVSWFLFARCGSWEGSADLS